MDNREKILQFIFNITNIRYVVSIGFDFSDQKSKFIGDKPSCG